MGTSVQALLVSVSQFLTSSDLGLDLVLELTNVHFELVDLLSPHSQLLPFKFLSVLLRIFQYLFLALLVADFEHGPKHIGQLGSVKSVPSVGPDPLLLLLVLVVSEPMLHADSPVESFSSLLKELLHLVFILVLVILQLVQIRLLLLDGVNESRDVGLLLVLIVSEILRILLDVLLLHANVSLTELLLEFSEDSIISGVEVSDLQVGAS